MKLCRHQLRMREQSCFPNDGRPNRCGAATLDYVLLLGVIFPLVAIVVPQGMRLVRGVYEMILVLISWPFM